MHGPAGSGGRVSAIRSSTLWRRASRQPTRISRQHSPVCNRRGTDADRARGVLPDHHCRSDRDARAHLAQLTYLHRTKPDTFNDFVLEADLSYEIDVWGRYATRLPRHGQRAGERRGPGDARSEYACRTRQRLLPAAQPGRAAELLDSTVTAYGQALELTQSLYDGGAGLLSDVDQAKRSSNRRAPRRPTCG